MADFKSAAVLVWMSPEQIPSIKSFEVSDDNMPEHAGFWELGAALGAALRNHERNKVPWIKVDNQLLSPDECLSAYERFKSGDDF